MVMFILDGLKSMNSILNVGILLHLMKIVTIIGLLCCARFFIHVVCFTLCVSK